MYDIGKNMFKMMLEGAAFETIDLGTDVYAVTSADAGRRHKPSLVGMSELLTTTMVSMRTTIEAFEEAGLRHSVKMMIGRAPVTAAFVEQIGAGACSPDAASAGDVARQLIEPQRGAVPTVSQTGPSPLRAKSASSTGLSTPA